MTHITAGNCLMGADGDVCAPAHRHAVIPGEVADFPDEEASQHSLEVRLGRPARLLLELQPRTCRWPLGDLDVRTSNGAGAPV